MTIPKMIQPVHIVIIQKKQLTNKLFAHIIKRIKAIDEDVK